MHEPILFNQQQMLDYFNLQPSEVLAQANVGTQFYKRYLYNLLYSVFNFTIPENWKLNYHRFWLLHYGSIGVIYTNEFGWVEQPYSIVKLDMYYNPKVIEVFNSFITEPKVGIIGTNAGIIHAFDDYYGFDDIISRYAEKLAQCDRSIDVSLMNSNITLMAEVEDKKKAEEVKTMYADATTGKPLTLINKNILNGNGFKPVIPNIKNNFIAPDVLQAKRTILNEFLTFIGIRNANYDKKERLNSQEVSENNDQTRAIVTVVAENIKTSCDIINSFSDLGLAVELNYDYMSEVVKEVDNIG